MEIKPQAVVIPKTDQLEHGKYGPIFPKTPACYGFTIIARVKPGRAKAIRNYGPGIVKALEANPHLLAPLKPIPIWSAWPRFVLAGRGTTK